MIPLLLSLSLAQGPQLPDIHIILMDDVGLEDLAEASTPNLDLLASQGVSFDRAYTAAWCAPTRSSLLRGRWRSYYHGSICGADVGGIPAVDLDSTETMLPAVVEAMDYETVLVGKWHMGHPRPSYVGMGELFGPHSIGFDHWAAGVASGSGCWPSGNHVVDDGAFRLRTEYPSDDQMDSYQALIVHAAMLKKPFFGVLGFTDAHSPWVISPPGYTPAPTERGRYLQEIEYLDEKIGELLPFVGASDWIFVMGDNGTPDQVSPEPGRSKLTVYERGIRVPLIARGPGLAPGSTSSKLVSVVDLFATVTDILGMPVQSDGESIFAAGRDWTYATNPTFDNGIGRHALIEDCFKLIRTPSGEEFYDLCADPDELSPLPLSGPDYDRVLLKLEAVL